MIGSASSSVHVIDSAGRLVLVLPEASWSNQTRKPCAVWQAAQDVLSPRVDGMSKLPCLLSSHCWKRACRAGSPWQEPQTSDDMLTRASLAVM